MIGYFSLSVPSGLTIYWLVVSKTILIPSLQCTYSYFSWFSHNFKHSLLYYILYTI